MSLSDDEGRRLNLLVAYPYMTASIIKILAENQSRVRFLLDSGAFTAWKAGKPIAIDDYCRFIENLPIKPWRYFTLDVIGDPAGSLKNYEILIKRGFKPVPIFTRGESPSALDEYYKTSDVVGIGGLVGTQKNRGFVNGIMKHVGKRRVHWLGFTSTEYLKQYRPYMCDSSSWAGALIFASLKIYDKGGRFVACQKKDFVRHPSPDIVRLLREYEIDPMLFAKASNWKNSGKGDYPTEMVAFRSFVKFQREVGTELGTKIFMAVASDWQTKLSLEAYDFWDRKRVA
jgi:hypothetical protein